MMRTNRLRWLLRKGGFVGVVLVGLYLLLHGLLANRRRALLLVIAAGLFAALACPLLFVLKAALFPAHLHNPALQEGTNLPSVKEHGNFYLDYRLPASQEGNSVAVVGYWQERKENLPHSCALWALDPFNWQAHRLLYGSLVSYQMDWQPGGNRLAFTGDSFIYAGAKIALPLWIAEVSSGHKIEIVVPESQKWYVSHFRWSPNGKWLAYNRAIWPYQYGKSQGLGTWIVSADGRQQFRLPVPCGVERFELVGWRPGTSELYVSEGYPYADRSLWLCDLRGNARKLPVPATYPASVNASRRGDYFCVRTQEKDGSFTSHRVRIFTVDGTPALDLGLIDQAGDAKWSANGKWLAVANRNPYAGNVTLRLLQGNGTHRKEVIAGYGREYQPTTIIWSPNGRQMLVTSEREYLVNAEQGISTRFQSTFWPRSWRADGRLIGLSYNRIAILSQKGEVEKVFPPETFLGAE
jgi:hypothetical protein